MVKVSVSVLTRILKKYAYSYITFVIWAQLAFVNALVSQMRDSGYRHSLFRQRISSAGWRLGRAPRKSTPSMSGVRLADAGRSSATIKTTPTIQATSESRSSANCTHTPPPLSTIVEHGVEASRGSSTLSYEIWSE